MLPRFAGGGLEAGAEEARPFVVELSQAMRDLVGRRDAMAQKGLDELPILFAPCGKLAHREVGRVWANPCDAASLWPEER